MDLNSHGNAVGDVDTSINACDTSGGIDYDAGPLDYIFPQQKTCTFDASSLQQVRTA